MEADFWHQMWASGEVGFHQKQVNEFLETHWADLAVPTGAEVLVPLCGKSLDMLWLKQQGYSILGVELSQKALDEFLQENQLNASHLNHDQFCGYELEQMRLCCGDFFHLQAQDCSQVKAVYDRAALIALPPAMRASYVAHIRQLLPLGTVILLVTMEYDQSVMQGPPFAVHPDEVARLYQGVAQMDVLGELPFERRGRVVNEKIYKIVL